MKQSNIENTILQNLYEAFFLGDDAANLNQICKEGGWEQSVFWKIVDHLVHRGLIGPWTMGGNFKIESLGVIHVEENGLASDKLIKENQAARTMLLDTLAKVYEEGISSFSDAHIQTLIEKTGLGESVAVNNLQVLKDLMYIESTEMGTFKISYIGLEAVEDWRQWSSLIDEFRQISEMSPHSRGRAFQKLFAKIVKKHGWSQEEGVRTSHEEMDVIVYREREYYLVECKWEKDPIEASVVRELYGKLGNRIGVQGMIVSMSGFTSGAVTQAENYANSRVILLFGPEDVRSQVFEESSFDTLLNEKYQQLITRKKIVFR